MFRIPEFFVEDKNLPKVLTALAGLTLNLKAPQPVHNAVANGDKVEATTGKHLYEQVHSALHKKLITGATFDGSVLLEVVSALGHPDSKGYMVKVLTEKGFIKPTKKYNTYILV